MINLPKSYYYNCQNLINQSQVCLQNYYIFVDHVPIVSDSDEHRVTSHGSGRRRPDDRLRRFHHESLVPAVVCCLRPGLPRGNLTLDTLALSDFKNYLDSPVCLFCGNFFFSTCRLVTLELPSPTPATTE